MAIPGCTRLDLVARDNGAACCLCLLVLLLVANSESEASVAFGSVQLLTGLVGVIVGGLITAGIQWFVMPGVRRKIRKDQQVEEGADREQAGKLSAWALRVEPIRRETDIWVDGVAESPWV